MTRTKLSAAIVALGFLTVVPAVASAQVNVSGAWEVTMTTPQGDNTVDVSFKQQGEALTGELTSPLGVAPFKGTLVKDALTVVANIDVQGTAVELTFNAKVTGDTLAGMVNFGGLGEAPFSGKRKGTAASIAAPAAASTASAPAPAPAAATSTAGAAGAISGNWAISLNVGGQEMPLTASFTQEGTALSGSLTSEQGSMPVKGTMTGNALKLEFTAPTPNGDLAVVMTGTLVGGALTGKMDISGLGEAEWTGQRAK
jgi:hypothetical protein